VAVGDTVELNQPLAEVETAKALVELPSPFAGVIRKLYAEAGTTVLVGAPIVAFELEGATGDAPDAAPDAADAAAKPEREPVLVGYGPPIEGGSRPARRARRGSSPVEPSSSPVEPSSSPVEPVETPRHETPRSTPPVRKLARDL